MRSTPDRRDVAIVGGVAVALVLASEAWREDFAQYPYLQRVFIVTAGGFLAVMAAAGRARIGLDRERFAALAAVAEIADGRIDGALSAFAVGEQADDTAVLAVERVAVASAERKGSGG